jgi:hypothetical protein
MILETVMGCTHLGRKPQGLIDRESREMNVILGAINDISTEFLGDLLGGKRVIVDLPFDEMIFCALIGKRLQ